MVHHDAKPPAHATRTGNDAVWSLVLPAAERVLCHTTRPPALLHELVRRGARVDVVSRCDLEAWLQAVPGGGAGRLRCLWEPDRDVDYDLALLWDPSGAAETAAWVEALRDLPLAPRELAVWSRNPLQHGPAPHWLGIDRQLRRGGWRLGEAHLALPDPQRVRQIVEWHAWGRTPLLKHRRTYRAWKAWVTRRGAYRWLVPARLRRATQAGVPARDSVWADLVRAAGQHCGAAAHLDRLLVSPNGVAIASLRLYGAGGTQNAILKAPYATAAEGRVARNAAALEWIQAQEARLGSWGHSAPRLLGRGDAGRWSWTLEERVEGSEAQSWNDAARVRALHHLSGFLEALSRLGEPACTPDRASLERLVGAPVRVAAARLEPDLARRLHALGEQLVQTLATVRVPMVPRHGDFKLENVLGDPAHPERARVLDWELFAPRGLPLLDLWHLIVSRRARSAGCSMGAAVHRWLLPGDLDDAEKRLVGRLARNLDRRYVEISPLLYWLDRVGPVAARGWPTPAWERANVAPVLQDLEMPSEVRG